MRTGSVRSPERVHSSSTAVTVVRLLLSTAGVAGVSIANVMPMPAIGRREEIGVLRSVGYEKLDIVRVMLAEAALLGVVGSVFGGALALAAVAGINGVLLGAPFAFTVEALRG